MAWFQSPELLTVVASNLDGASLAQLARTCKFVPENLTKTPAALSFVASMRGAMRRDMSTLEQFHLADCILELRTEIKFRFREVHLEASSMEPRARRAARTERKEPTPFLPVVRPRNVPAWVSLGSRASRRSSCGTRR